LARNWSAVLDTWAQSPSETELEKAKNAERVIRKAIDASEDLADLSLVVFAQGSYRNRTNVRQDSDVDICVLSSDFLFPDYTLTPGLTDADTGLEDSTYTYSMYRDALHDALVSYLGGNGVTRGKKAFDVHANTYRLDADVVACFEFRQYQQDEDETYSFESGTCFVPDGGQLIHNWPQQNYDNGTLKNEQSERFYKPCVRIFKHLRNEMLDVGFGSATATPSFLLESMLYNLPNEAFLEPSWTKTLRGILVRLDELLDSDEAAREMVEVNELKYLFRGGQPWTLAQAQAFVVDAWEHHHDV
jgi:hypothetical protein